MSDPLPTSAGPYSTVSGPVQWQEVLAEHRRQWQSGTRLRVEEVLRDHPDMRENLDAMFGLVVQEISLRARSAETPIVAEYVGRFPEIEERLRRHFAVSPTVSARLNQEQATYNTQWLAQPQLAGETRLPHEQAPTAPAELPATMGEYEVLGELGRGGMGVVYKARHRTLHRFAALKMILAGRYAGPEHRRRLLAEAESIARLQHPNVVQIFDTGTYDGHLYLALEYVDGTTLAGKLAGAPMEPEKAARTVAVIARAVHAAHECGVIHRDLKPSNVLLTRSGDPKVTDFGLAKRVGEDSGETVAGDILGTPSYMAPEQAAGQSHDATAAADIYALGAILYETLAGRPPFRAASLVQTLDQVRHDDPVPLRRLQPRTPRDLETICLKCLHKQPERRYRTAAELADELERFLAHEPIEARPIGPLERMRKWTRRRPAVASLLALVVTVAALGAGGIVFQWRRAEAARAAEAERADAETLARQEAERLLYLSRVALADRELAAGKPAWAQEQLELCPESLRGWEWYHLDRGARGEMPVELKAGEGGVSCVAVSADDAIIASAHASGAIRLWDAANGSEQATLRGHKGAVSWVAFAPNGPMLASAGEDGRILLWDSKTKEKPRELAAVKGPLSGVSFQPGGRLIAASAYGVNRPGEAYVWEIESGKLVATLTGHTSRVSGLAFSPDGTTLATVSHDKTVRLWDPASGAEKRTFAQHGCPLSCVAFSPDGTQIASAGGQFQANRPEDGEVLIWDAATGEVIQRLRGHTRRLVSVAFSPDGERLATGGWDAEIKLWHLGTGQELLGLRQHHDSVMSIAWSRDGDLLVSGGLDQLVLLWKGKP